MADFKRGIKAGVAAAAVYLIISVILELSHLSPSGITLAAGLTIQLELTDPSFMIFSILGRIVRGIVFGAVFAALYDYLPGTTSVKKGVVFSSFLWILGAVELIYTIIIPGWPRSGDGALWSASLTVAGVRPADKSVAVAAAWNLVGSVGESAANPTQPVPPDPPCAAIWQYNNPGGYVVPTEC